MQPGLDVAEAEGKGLDAAGIVVDFGDVVGHDHGVVAYFLVSAEGFEHVDGAVVGEGLGEAAEAAFDVAEMDVEDFFAGAEVADVVVDLFVGIDEAFADGSLAEVETVVGALFDGDELLQAFGGEDGFDAAPAFAFGHGGVVGVAGHFDFVFVGDGDNAIEEVGDAFPIDVGGDGAGFGKRWFLLAFGVAEAALDGSATALGGFGGDDAEDGHVVLDGTDAGGFDVFDHLADVVDGAIAFGGLAVHDGGVFVLGDVGRAEGEGHHVKVDAELFDAVFEGFETVDAPFLVELAGGEGGADIFEAEGGEQGEVFVVVVVLVADLHEDGLALAFCFGGGGGQLGGGGEGRALEELAALHD